MNMDTIPASNQDGLIKALTISNAERRLIIDKLISEICIKDKEIGLLKQKLESSWFFGD